MNQKLHYESPQMLNFTLRQLLIKVSVLLFFVCSAVYTMADTAINVQQTGQSTSSNNTDPSIIKVNGVVTDAEGNPVIGANIFVVNANKSYITDINGKFNLETSKGSTLQVTYIGCVPQSIKVVSQNIKVQLEDDVQRLEDIVVVGYGTQVKKNLTGAVASISGNEVITTKATNVTSSLAGKISGVNIRQFSGQPGSNDVQFNIRGFGTPMFVIDGVPRSDASSFSRLNPDDIENISILKDATAAVYGIGSGNGVVIVTTKKGTFQKPKVTYSGVFGISVPTGMPEMCNAAEWVMLRNEAEVNAGRNPMWSQEEYNKWQTGAPGYESTDWQNVIMNKSANQQQHMVSVNGGTENAKYFVSFGYLTETGLLKNSNDISYDQYNFRTNLSFKFNKNLRAEFGISGTSDFRKSTAVSYASIISQAHTIPPIYKVYANDNPNYYNDVYPSNPAAYSSVETSGYSNFQESSLNTNSALIYDVPFVKGLTAKAMFSYDTYNGRNTYLNKGYNVYSYSANDDTYTAIPKNKPANISKSADYSSLINLQGSLDYKKSFGNHNLNGTVLWETIGRSGESFWLSREYEVYTNDVVDQANNLESQLNGGSDWETRNLSLITRAHYDYKGKYLIDFASRYDGSYRYAPGHRWGFFPSVSGAWRISEENFIKNSGLAATLTNLKLRASYGQSGEDAGNAFQWIPGYMIGSGSGYIFSSGNNTQGAAPSALTTENLTWLRVHTMDIGLDASLWNGLFGIEFDWYKRDRTGLLSYATTSVPWYFGQSLPQENLNSDRYMGLDLTLSSAKRFGDFSYSVRGVFNYARYQRLHIEQYEPNTAFSNWWSNSTNRLTGLQGSYMVIGRFQNEEEIIQAPNHDASYGGTLRMLPGDFIYRDTNGDGFITDLDKRQDQFYNSTPKINYGFNVNLAWKNFDLNLLLNGALLYSLKYNGIYTTMLGDNGSGNAPKYMLDRWHKADVYNTNSEWIEGNWPAIRKTSDVTSIYYDSDFWRKKGDYMRLKSVEIGYTLPKSLSQKMSVENTRFYVNGYNLFTICDPFLKPFDPEKGDGNSTYSYPLSRLFNIGVNFTF